MGTGAASPVWDAAESPSRRVLSRREVLRMGAGMAAMAAGLGRWAAVGAAALPANITATVNAETLNVRSGPSTGDPVRGKLHQGDRVTCVGTAGTWFQITTPHVAGYVSSPLVNLDAAHPARFIPRGLTTRPLVCLTFDCGADRGYADRIINVLASHRARSTFGMSGNWADENPDLTRRIAADGHHFINHTRTHRSFTGASTNTDPLAPSERLEELEWTEAKLKQLIGHGAKPWFRTPYSDGDDDPGVLRDVAADGFTYDVGFTVDTLGWKGASVDEIVERVMSHHGNGYIYLLHVGAQSQDSAALDRLMTGLRDAGYGFSTIPEVLGVSTPAASPGRPGRLGLRRREAGFKAGEPCRERRGSRLLVSEELGQTLDGGEGDALPVHRADMTVVRANPERGGEVLRHRAEVADGRIAVAVVPGFDREGRHPRQHRLPVHRRKVRLERPVTEGEEAAVGCLVAEPGAALGVFETRRPFPAADVSVSLRARAPEECEKDPRLQPVRFLRHVRARGDGRLKPGDPLLRSG